MTTIDLEGSAPTFGIARIFFPYDLIVSDVGREGGEVKGDSQLLLQDGSLISGIQRGVFVDLGRT